MRFSKKVALLPARSAYPDSVGDLVGGLLFASTGTVHPSLVAVRCSIPPASGGFHLSTLELVARMSAAVGPGWRDGTSGKLLRINWCFGISRRLLRISGDLGMNGRLLGIHRQRGLIRSLRGLLVLGALHSLQF